MLPWRKRLLVIICWRGQNQNRDDPSRSFISCFEGQVTSSIPALLTSFAAPGLRHGERRKGDEKTAIYLVGQKRQCPIWLADQTLADTSIEKVVSRPDLRQLRPGGNENFAPSLVLPAYSRCGMNRLS